MPDQSDPSADFAAARRRCHEATEAAAGAPTHDNAMASIDAAIEDYNRAVDAYNAAHGLTGRDEDALMHLSRDEYIAALTAATEDPS